MPGRSRRRREGFPPSLPGHSPRAVAHRRYRRRYGRHPAGSIIPRSRLSSRSLSRRFGCSTGGHAARDDDHARGAAIESGERTRGTRRGTDQGECAAGADRRTERRDGDGPGQGRPGVGGGTAAGGPAERTGGSAVGRRRAGRAAGGGCRRPSRTAEAGRGAERARAETSVSLLALSEQLDAHEAEQQGSWKNNWPALGECAEAAEAARYAADADWRAAIALADQTVALLTDAVARAERAEAGRDAERVRYVAVPSAGGD